MESTKIRTLGPLLSYLDEIDNAMSYAYEDLVFTKNNVFILQFDESKENAFFVYFNEDCEEQAKKNISTLLTTSSKSKGIDITIIGHYSLKSSESNEELTIEFFPIGDLVS